MKLKKDARIYRQDGKEIGNLNRFVLHPQTKDVTHIVIEQGLLDKEEYLVPMQMIERVDERGIHLRELPFDKTEGLQKFAEDQYVITNEEALLEQGYVSDEMVRRYYYYPSPPYGGAGLLRPDDTYIYNPPEQGPTPTQLGVPVSGTGDVPVRKEDERNIPEEMVALTEGAKVISSDHEVVGNIEKVLVDPQNKKATHVVVTKGLLTKEQRLVPVDWIRLMGEREVYLSMDEKFIQGLPEYKE